MKCKNFLKALSFDLIGYEEWTIIGLSCEALPSCNETIEYRYSLTLYNYECNKSTIKHFFLEGEDRCCFYPDQQCKIEYGCKECTVKKEEQNDGTEITS